MGILPNLYYPNQLQDTKLFSKCYNTLQESEDCNALHPKHSVTFPPSVSKMHEEFYNTQLAVFFQIFN